MIRTVVSAWNVGARVREGSARDPSQGLDHVLAAQAYVDDVRARPASRARRWANWFGAKDPQKRIPFFAGFAVDQNTWFDVMDEMKLIAGGARRLEEDCPTARSSAT